MKNLLIFTGLVTVAMILWSTLGYLMDLPSFHVSLPLTMISLLLFIGTGILKNRVEKKKFQAFLESMRRDSDLQQRLKQEHIPPGEKTGRSKIKAYYRERNSGVTWTGASVHGAVPKRNKRRDFLTRNR